MKTYQEGEHLHEITIGPEAESGIFIGMNTEPLLVGFNQEYDGYLKNHGKLDMFSFIEHRIRIMRAEGDRENASRYGLVCLVLYGQELLKVYERVVRDEKMSIIGKNETVSWLLSRMSIREVMWLIHMGEHQKRIEELFRYWKERFGKILNLLQKAKFQYETRDIAQILNLSEQEILRILNED